MLNSFKNFFDSMATLPLGMVFVILVLLGFYLLCALIGKAFTQPKKQTGATPKTKMAAVDPEAADTQDKEAELDESTILVITAAVDRMLEGQAFRVISVKPLGYSSWVEQGRADIFRSHHSL